MTDAERNVQVVKDFRAAQVLLDKPQLSILRAFMTPGGQTIKAVAEQLRLDLNNVYRRVQRFEQLGLLKVVAHQKRRGRDVKVYRATAQEFFIPTSLYPLNEYFLDLFQPFAERFRLNYHRIFEHCEKPVGGILAGQLASGHFYGMADQQMQVFTDYGADSPAAVFHGTVLRLGRTAARELEGELFNLLMKYTGQQEEDGRPHVLTVLYHPQYIDPESQ
ncbi:winged helix-turn-helix domain-containing protein [Deinococcus fonticola]|uniref:winged helix-turn-helix domain-containing protein n=1 Tax=Deinococcus fonticola TaxID=2528713 RepID=UPI0014315BA4|nr:helix-turn-helix domain-containing protein [Deinococcus fonticola]